MAVFLLETCERDFVIADLRLPRWSEAESPPPPFGHRRNSSTKRLLLSLFSPSSLSLEGEKGTRLESTRAEGASWFLVSGFRE